MPLTVESRDVALGDGRGTSFTFQSEHGQIVLLAVRLAVLLLESILAKLAAALGAEKVIRMPRLIQSRHAFLFNVQFGIDDGKNIKKKKHTNPKNFKKSNKKQANANKKLNFLCEEVTETSCLTQPVVHPFIRFISQTYVCVRDRSLGWLVGST